MDDSPAPLPLIPLSTTVPTPADGFVDYALTNVSLAIVRGTARIE